MSNNEQQLKRTEDELRTKLYELVVSITGLVIGQAARPSQATESPTTPTILSSPLIMYEDEVSAIFRKFAQDGYLLGIAHVAEALQQEGYLTHADIDAIKQISSEHSARFWARVQRGIIEKEMQIQNLQFTGEAPDTHLTREWIVDAIASSDVFTSYNEAVRTKASRLTT